MSKAQRALGVSSQRLLTAVLLILIGLVMADPADAQSSRAGTGPYQDLIDRYLESDPAHTDYVVLR